ncbi:MAG: fibronectin type III domain-containing protein, partial [Gallionella sp.]|nr:fibronectin type III domain-containing protein [Gallionella sp.]
EFYHAGLDHYFRTADAGEASGIDNGAAGAGWVRTGDDFRAYSAATALGGAVPVCRFYGSVSPGPNSHFYTASQEECAGLKALQQSTPDGEKRWNYEGLAFAVALPSTAGCPAGSTSIYRLYNNGFARGADSNHRYTSLQSEYQRLQSAGWGGESVVMCSPSSSSSSSLSPPASVALANAESQTVGGNAFSSSTQLTLSWTAPSGYTVDHYAISASESAGNTSLSYSVAASGTSATLTGLKSGTSYSVVVSACKDAACAEAGSAAAVSGKTSEEYWQLQGSGNSVSTLTKPVSDGNARLSATRFGAEAGAAANTVQFYYGPQGVSGQAVASSGSVSSSNSASYLTGFTSYASTSGLRSPLSSTSGINSIMTGQGVPLSAEMGAKVRLFFESNDTDGKTRIYSVDSVDGYIGRDFNSGSATTCSAAADYLSTGNCPATLVIGVEGDATNPTSKISAARQNKIAWPTLTDWRWDGAVGTFMVFTVDQISGCTTASHNHAYAVWDGTAFVPQFDSSGCPKTFKSAQAALPMHIGDVRYKMYYGDPSVTTGRPAGSSLPFVGPKKLIYADGRSSGNTSIVDYEDWESVGSARNVVFLWPNGDQLNDTAEGHIDDFHFLTPTGNLDIQVLYLSITDGSVVPFAATAVLLNP